MKVRKLRAKSVKGVRIGDNESQIVARLGRPQKIERSVGDQVRILRYASTRNGHEAYMLKAGRLVEIRVSGRREDEE